MNKTKSHLHMFSKKIIITLNLHRPFVATESAVWIFFIFRSSMIRVSRIDVVSSLSPPRCHPSSGWCHHAAASCHASFSWSQDEPATSTLSSGNTSSHRLPSRTETEPLNPHHRRPPHSPDSLTSTLHCYKKIISTLATLPINQQCLHFASSLARAPRHRSSIYHRRSLSPPSHVHCLSIQRHPQWWTSRPFRFPKGLLAYEFT
jgi:hypothetical protein